MDILSTGYFLVSREAFKFYEDKTWVARCLCGFKNGLAASPTHPLTALQKLRNPPRALFSLEGAEAGIRVNVVNPDAILRAQNLGRRMVRAAR